MVNEETAEQRKPRPDCASVQVCSDQTMPSDQVLIVLTVPLHSIVDTSRRFTDRTVAYVAGKTGKVHLDPLVKVRSADWPPYSKSHEPPSDSRVRNEFSSRLIAQYLDILD